MSIVSAIVLFAVYWFITLLVVLPLRLETQGDRGEIEPGTHAGSPADPQMKKRFIVTTCVAFVLWAITVAVVVTGTLTMQDLDIFNRM